MLPNALNRVLGAALCGAVIGTGLFGAISVVLFGQGWFGRGIVLLAIEQGAGIGAITGALCSWRRLSGISGAGSCAVVALCELAREAVVAGGDPGFVISVELMRFLIRSYIPLLVGMALVTGFAIARACRVAKLAAATGRGAVLT